MTNNIYALLNVLSGRFGDVVAYPTDSFARARTIDIMKKCNLSTVEYQLWKIGSIDVESGQLTVVKPVIITGLVDEESPVKLPIIMDLVENQQQK